MEFVWDVEKNKANRTKHGISFEAAVAIWDSVHLENEEKTFTEKIQKRGGNG